MVKSDYSIAHRCALYTPGHNVHFVQTRLAWENPEAYLSAEFVMTGSNPQMLSGPESQGIPGLIGSGDRI